MLSAGLMGNKGKPAGFDRVATAYRFLETITFGSYLQRARTAHLKEIAEAENILLAGEGNGLFLKALLAANSRCHVTCLDASQAMLDLTRKRIGEKDSRRVCFAQTDVARESLSTKKHDALVTHFFLDCFNRETLKGLLTKLERALQPQGKWLLADFEQPPKGQVLTFFQRSGLRFLYTFFKVSCGIEASTLCNPKDILLALGMKETKRRSYLKGWITSLVYEKTCN